MRPSRDQVLMQHAEIAALRGTCSRKQVGVVISLDGRVIVTGYNGAPAGIEHCHHPCICKENLPPGNIVPEVYEWCPQHGSHPSLGCTEAVHAEANAIAFAARHGLKLEGAVLHTTTSTCLNCARLVINAGIIRVAAGEQYRDPEGMRLLLRAGIQLS